MVAAGDASWQAQDGGSVGANRGRRQRGSSVFQQPAYRWGGSERAGSGVLAPAVGMTRKAGAGQLRVAAGVASLRMRVRPGRAPSGQIGLRFAAQNQPQIVAAVNVTAAADHCAERLGDAPECCGPSVAPRMRVVRDSDDKA